MAEDLDERVLHGFVGFGGVAQILIRDAQRAPLMDDDQLAEPLARLVHLAALRRSSRISIASRVSSRPAARRRGRGRGADAGNAPRSQRRRSIARGDADHS